MSDLVERLKLILKRNIAELETVNNSDNLIFICGMRTGLGQVLFAINKMQEKEGNVERIKEFFDPSKSCREGSEW